MSTTQVGLSLPDPLVAIIDKAWRADRAESRNRFLACLVAHALKYTGEIPSGRASLDDLTPEEKKKRQLEITARRKLIEKGGLLILRSQMAAIVAGRDPKITLTKLQQSGKVKYWEQSLEWTSRGLE